MKNNNSNVNKKNTLSKNISKEHNSNNNAFKITSIIILFIITIIISSLSAILIYQKKTPSLSNIKDSLYITFIGGWKEQDGYFYYYQNSKMKTGWLNDKGKWYFLGDDGKMRTGWIQYHDKWYFLNTDGSMATNTTINGCYFDQNGIWTDTPDKH